MNLLVALSDYRRLGWAWRRRLYVWSGNSCAAEGVRTKGICEWKGLDYGEKQLEMCLMFDMGLCVLKSTEMKDRERT